MVNTDEDCAGCRKRAWVPSWSREIHYLSGFQDFKHLIRCGSCFIYYVWMFWYFCPISRTSFKIVSESNFSYVQATKLYGQHISTAEQCIGDAAIHCLYICLTSTSLGTAQYKLYYVYWDIVHCLSTPPKCFPCCKAI